MGLLSELVQWSEDHERAHDHRDPALAGLMRREHKRVNALVDVCRGLVLLIVLAWAAVLLLVVEAALR